VSSAKRLTLNGSVGVVLGYAVVGEQEVKEGTEPLSSPRVEDQHLADAWKTRPTVYYPCRRSATTH
jgi:hypothetical protein